MPFPTATHENLNNTIDNKKRKIFSALSEASSTARVPKVL